MEVVDQELVQFALKLILLHFSHHPTLACFVSKSLDDTQKQIVKKPYFVGISLYPEMI